MAHSRLSTRNAKRYRRARRRGRMIPAEAQKLSTRTRNTDYPVTKNIARFHHYNHKWFFSRDWFED